MENREIDALVASKIMGWSLSIASNSPWQMLPPEGSTGRKEGRVYNVPRYSTDISAAWQVIQKMQSDGWHYEICDSHWEPSHYVKFGRGKYDPYDDMFREEHSATGPTPWMAICLAALEAVGVDIAHLS